MRGRQVGVFACLFLSLSAQEITLGSLEFKEDRVFRYRVHDFVADFARTNFYLFSKESLLVGFLMAPFYGLARKVDDRVHSSIYDSYEHRNLFDIGSCVKPFVEDIGLAIPIVGLTAGLLLSNNPNNKVTGSLLLGGLASIGIAKEALKAVSADCEIGTRPYCSFFKKKRVHNGFPSGHAATVTYMTLLFAFRKGIKWAFPIGVCSGLIMGLMVGCNYHYPSQVVAGIGLGTIYALAANKVAVSRLKENWEINFSLTRKGAPQFSAEYSF
jgi:membrane-associated phospholipid phosphatase